VERDEEPNSKKDDEANEVARSTLGNESDREEERLMIPDSEDDRKLAAVEEESPFMPSTPTYLCVPQLWKANGIYNP
jgi:hypothetical protein